MKIHFIGLSCFLIENTAGFRVLVDPFEDKPEVALGPIFPTEFNWKPFGTNLLLISETDEDHARAPHGWQQNAPEILPNSNPFPDLNLKGTLVHEWNGEACIAWHYTIDGIRLAHFSDHAHMLSEVQIREIGNPDIIFYPLPKVGWDDQKAFDIIREDIRRLNPKIVIWSHHIPPKNMPSIHNEDALRAFFIDYFRDNASTSKYYKGEESFMELHNMIFSGANITKELGGILNDTTMLEVNQEELNNYQQPTPIFFTSMLAYSKTD